MYTRVGWMARPANTAPLAATVRTSDSESGYEISRLLVCAVSVGSSRSVVPPRSRSSLMSPPTVCELWWCSCQEQRSDPILLSSGTTGCPRRKVDVLGWVLPMIQCVLRGWCEQWLCSKSSPWRRIMPAPHEGPTWTEMCIAGTPLEMRPILLLLRPAYPPTLGGGVT